LVSVWLSWKILAFKLILVEHIDMSKELYNEKKWVKAFVRFGFDASVGRLFRGVIHNLNGVGQAFSMQTELLLMMFGQADDTLAKLDQADTLESAREQAAGLREMLAKRAVMAQRLTGVVNTLQETMKRTSVLMEESRDPAGVHAFKLREVITTEIEFMNSDGFFKHKVNKEMSLAENIPALACHRVELHQILSVLLENASQAMTENFNNEPNPSLTVSTTLENGYVDLRVMDSGPGISGEDLETVFAPFYTTREDRLGLGLFLAREMAGRCGGIISCESQPGETCFTLRIPVVEGSIES
jgi:signal transduction histidine kinase